MAVLQAVVLSAVALLGARADTLVHQASNPHISEGSCGLGGFDDLLELPYLETLKTQADTFVGHAFAKTAAGAPVSLYDFTQPARLNPAELPFSVAPVAYPRGDPRLLVASESNGDSWFPGYSWQVVGATNACGSLTHLGWKFTSPDSTFLALIVRRSSEDEAARVFRVGSPATAAMAALLLHASSKL